MSDFTTGSHLPIANNHSPHPRIHYHGATTPHRNASYHIPSTSPPPAQIFIKSTDFRSPLYVKQKIQWGDPFPTKASCKF